MIKANFHTHSHYCDGKGQIEEYIKIAIEKGLKSIGISGHAPIHIDNYWTMKEEDLEDYFQDVNDLKEKYKNDIEIYLGLEIDYFAEANAPKMDRYKEKGLDYVLGSVHMIYDEESKEYLAVDADYEEYQRIIEHVFKGDIEKFVKTYYGLIRDMVKKYKPDIVGHIDLLRKGNKDNIYFTGKEKWYRHEVMETLKAIKENGCIIEMNTGGKSRGYIDDFYPSDWILIECKKLEIPVMINSDAHAPENVDAYFEEAEEKLKLAGYSEKYIMRGGRWQKVSI